MRQSQMSNKTATVFMMMMKSSASTPVFLSNGVTLAAFRLWGMVLDDIDRLIILMILLVSPILTLCLSQEVVCFTPFYNALQQDVGMTS